MPQDGHKFLLVDLHFSNVDIGNGLQEEASFTEVSDTDLDTITRQSVDTPKLRREVTCWILKGNRA